MVMCTTCLKMLSHPSHGIFRGCTWVIHTCTTPAERALYHPQTHVSVSGLKKLCCDFLLFHERLIQANLLKTLHETQFESYCITGFFPLQISAAVRGSWRWLCNTHTHAFRHTHRHTKCRCTDAHRYNTVHTHTNTRNKWKGHTETSVNVCGLASELQMTVQHN